MTAVLAALGSSRSAWPTARNYRGELCLLLGSHHWGRLKRRAARSLFNSLAVQTGIFEPMGGAPDRAEPSVDDDSAGKWGGGSRGEVPVFFKELSHIGLMLVECSNASFSPGCRVLQRKSRICRTSRGMPRPFSRHRYPDLPTVPVYLETISVDAWLGTTREVLRACQV